MFITSFCSTPIVVELALGKILLEVFTALVVFKSKNLLAPNNLTYVLQADADSLSLKIIRSASAPKPCPKV